MASFLNFVFGSSQVPWKIACPRPELVSTDDKVSLYPQDVHFQSLNEMRDLRPEFTKWSGWAAVSAEFAEAKALRSHIQSFG